MRVKLLVDLLDDDDKPIIERAGLEHVAEAMRVAGVKPAVIERILQGMTAYVDEADAKPSPMTLASAIRDALRAIDPEGKADYDDRIELSLRIRQAGSGQVELSEKEVDLILARVKAHHHRPIIHYRVNRALSAARASHQAAPAG